MMGKPNTLEEQEEQKKREAESFFAQKDSGTNREQSEVTPPTPPKKPGFWDWLAGVFGYETQTTKNWKQYTEKLASYQETVRRQEEEPAAERAAKEREELEDLEDFPKDEPSAEKQKDGPDLNRSKGKMAEDLVAYLKEIGLWDAPKPMCGVPFKEVKEGLIDEVIDDTVAFRVKSDCTRYLAYGHPIGYMFEDLS